jgi:hypothetical protein
MFHKIRHITISSIVLHFFFSVCLCRSRVRFFMMDLKVWLTLCRYPILSICMRLFYACSHILQSNYYVCTFVDSKLRANHWTDFHWVWCLRILWKIVQPFQHLLKSVLITTLREDIWAFQQYLEHNLLNIYQGEKCFRQKLQRELNHTVHTFLNFFIQQSPVSQSHPKIIIGLSLCLFLFIRADNREYKG